jgi:hypothetical protein
VSQYVSGNFPGIFGIFRIFLVAFMNYLAISRLFFSQKYFLKIKRNCFLLSIRPSLLAQFLFQPNNQSLPCFPISFTRFFLHGPTDPIRSALPISACYGPCEAHLGLASSSHRPLPGLRRSPVPPRLGVRAVHAKTT